VLLDLPLSRTQLDRAAQLRTDDAALAQLWQRAKIIDLLGDRFRCANQRLDFIDSAAPGERYFLGLAPDQTPYFVAHRRLEAKELGEQEFPEHYQTLRTLGKHLDQLEIGAAVHALALPQGLMPHHRVEGFVE